MAIICDETIKKTIYFFYFFSVYVFFNVIAFITPLCLVISTSSHFGTIFKVPSSDKLAEACREKGREGRCWRRLSEWPQKIIYASGNLPLRIAPGACRLHARTTRRGKFPWAEITVVCARSRGMPRGLAINAAIMATTEPACSLKPPTHPPSRTRFQLSARALNNLFPGNTLYVHNLVLRAKRMYAKESLHKTSALKRKDIQPCS